jgi:hypothetical protein
MLGNFLKAWVAFVVMLVVLGVMVFGGEYLHDRYGTTTFIAIAAAAFLVLVATGLWLRGKRRSS